MNDYNKFLISKILVN